MNAQWVRVPRPCLFFFFFFLLIASAAFGQSIRQVAPTIENSQRVTLGGNVHPLARAEFDRGAAESGVPMARVLLLLKRSDGQEGALQTYLEQQQDKSSANYQAWLTPAEFGALYGPADSDIQAVTQWLGSQGFAVNKVYSGKTVIEFSGTVGQVQAAFGVAIHNFQVNGKMYLANANDPQIPAALAPVISGIVSLNNFPRRSHVRIAGAARKIPGQPGVQPLFTFPNPFGGSGNFYALAPGDFATIYNSKGLIASGNDGTGQTIAIVGETNINVSDVQSFRQLFGLPATFTSSNIILNGPDPGITSVAEEGEADLDVQWSGAVAPGATIDFVVSASTSTSAGIDLSALYIIENNLAGEMSESYGECERGLGSGGNAFYKALWEQAAAQGITVILSAGDAGSAGCDDFDTETVAMQGLAVNGMASTPYNVALGGTDFDDVNTWSTYWSATNLTTGTDVIGTSALGYIPEIPWSQNCAQISLTFCGSSSTPSGSINIVAGSGGPSSVYSKPSWQLGVSGMPNDNHRDLPDVSLFASAGFDFSGYIVCQADAYAEIPCSITTPGGVNVQIVGGTSASAPAFAGIMALVNQYQGSHGGTLRQGNVNYVLYALAKKTGASCSSIASEANSCIFNDVTHGNTYVAKEYGSSTGTNSVPCQGGSLNCSATAASETGVLVEPTSATTEAWTAAAGYDLTTGLGSVNVANLINNWGSVSTVPTTTTLSLSPTQNITHGSSENVSVGITVTPKSGTATGDVSLIATLTGSSGTSQQGLAQYTLASNGTFSGSTDSLPGGSYTVAAHYAGDGTNAPSDSSPPVPITVSAESSKTFANLVTMNATESPTNFTASTVAYGSGYAIFRVDVGDSAATVSSSSGISSNCSKGITSCPTGVVTVSSSGTTPFPTSSMALNVLGYAETPSLPPGAYSVTAAYPGDASYGASSGSASFTISKAPTTVSVGVGGQPVQYGDTEQIGANLTTTSTGIAPTGTFQFLVDGNPVGAAVPVYESGSYSPGSTTTPNYAWADATSTTEFLSVGNHNLSAQYTGDANYAAATSPSVAVAVSKALPFFNTFGAQGSSFNVNQSVTLSAQLYGSDGGLPPTGTVTFYDGSNPVSGSVTYKPVPPTQLIGSLLQASVSYTFTTSGTHTITVSYSGDNNYLPATTPTGDVVTVVGPDFSLTPQPTSVTVASGTSATYAVAVAGTDGFNGSVSFTCSLAAAATTCLANPTSVSAGSSATITVTTTKHQLIPPSPFSLPVVAAPGILLCSAIAILFFLIWMCASNAARKKLLVGGAFATLAIVFGMAVFGCGGGGSGGGGSSPPPVYGTQAGTYVITITANSGNISHTTTVNLTVQ